MLWASAWWLSHCSGSGCTAGCSESRPSLERPQRRRAFEDVLGNPTSCRGSSAVAGLGISLLPTFFVHYQLVDGALTRIDIGVEAEGAELFIAYPRERSASAKVLALIESLRRSFRDPPYWDRASDQSPSRNTRPPVEA
ncbi:MAG: hypothetical protein E5W00_01580 [Mesorhizobium sp.]|nr:MAG: hypothetical protein E5W00_01580 [Mesorhizobium sp.]TIX07418.1 MAG: hypothetical protein E5V57_01395 [Mesorhizobium sp.]